MDARKDLIEAVTDVGTGPVSDAMERLGLPRGIITGMQLVSDNPRRTIIGPAFTLRQGTKSRSVPHDENRTRQRYASSEHARPGEVIVIDANGRTDICTWGENQALMATSRGIAGLVAHGAIRDSEGVRASGFPVMCRGFSPVSSTWDLETVALNEPVIIDSVQVRPGDLVYGDVDGVVIIPADAVESVLDGALDVVRVEAHRRAELYG